MWKLTPVVDAEPVISSPLNTICCKSINCVEFGGTERLDTKATVAKFIVAVAAEVVVLVIPMFVTIVAVLVGAVYNLVEEVEAAPLKIVNPASAILLSYSMII